MKGSLKSFGYHEEKVQNFRSSRPEVFLGKGVLKIRMKFTREHPCRIVISIKLLCNFIEIALRHGFSYKLAAYFQNTFSKENLWVAASENYKVIFTFVILVELQGYNWS